LFTAIDTATSTGPVALTSTAQTTASAIINTTSDSRTSVNAALPTGAPAYVNSKWYAFQESQTVASGQERIAGTYVYTIIVTPMGQAATTGTPQTVDLTITIGALASTALTASPASSTAFISSTSGASADDANPTALATASNTPAEYIMVNLRNASAVLNAAESVTITTNIGQVGTSSNRGRSVVLAYTAGGTVYNVYPDGTAGVATITISTPSVTFASKSVVFFAAGAKTITSTVAAPQLLVGANAGAVRATAIDAHGVNWGGQAYIVASSATDAAVAGSTTPVACAWNGTFLRHDCPVTGLAAGTAKLKVIDAATVALATATSNEVTVTVANNPVASVKLAFNKATYQAGEKAYITVTALDSAGKTLQGQTFANLLATGGITTSYAFGNGSDTLTAVSIPTSAFNSATSPATAGAKTYTVYMPTTGSVKITATGGASVALAGQVEVSATATVSDSATAALAAVTALATTVASLKTLITTLTNLVLKIQKKVKA
jgi:hypothetical protein